MRQVFQRTIHGGVAGRDVINVDLSNLEEFEAQQLFFEKTGISCTRTAREHLIYLGESCDFHYRKELKPAVCQGALAWDRMHRRWRVASAWGDYGVAGAFGLMAGLLAVVSGGLVLERLSGVHATLGSLLVVSVLFGVFATLHQQFVRPHAIARRAVAALCQWREAEEHYA